MTTAVLVLDMQRDFLCDTARMPVASHQVVPLIQNINSVVHHSVNAERPVIYIGNEFERSQILPNLFRHHAAMKGSCGALLDERLHVVNDVYFSKKVGSALSNPRLVEYLTKHHIRRLVMTGVFAEGCVLATAKHALKKGFEVIALSDAVAGANDSKRHNALYKFRKCGTHVKTVQEFLASDRTFVNQKSPNAP